MKNPGWIDLQVNGHAGVDYSEATLSEESFLRSAEALINDGTEIFCPTIVTGTLERFTRNAAVIRQAVEKHGTSIVGVLFIWIVQILIYRFKNKSL